MERKRKRIVKPNKSVIKRKKFDKNEPKMTKVGFSSAVTKEYINDFVGKISDQKNDKRKELLEGAVKRTEKEFKNITNPDKSLCEMMASEFEDLYNNKHIKRDNDYGTMELQTSSIFEDMIKFLDKTGEEKDKHVEMICASKKIPLLSVSYIGKELFEPCLKMGELYCSESQKMGRNGEKYNNCRAFKDFGCVLKSLTLPFERHRKRKCIYCLFSDYVRDHINIILTRNIVNTKETIFTVLFGQNDGYKEDALISHFNVCGKGAMKKHVKTDYIKTSKECKCCQKTHVGLRESSEAHFR